MSRKEYQALLATSATRLDNGNDWTGELQGIKFWIGHPSGSRTSQYEATITGPKGKCVQLWSKTHTALLRKIDAVLVNPHYDDYWE